MKSASRLIIGAIILILATAHLLVIGLFICPIPKLLDVALAQDVQYVALPDIPEHARQIFSDDQTVNLSRKGNLIQQVASRILMLRQQKFFDEDKRQELYLNTLNFGGDVIGIQSASSYYFKKPVSDLSFEEALTLAGLFKIFRQ
jgi:hypothetical protein